MIKIVILGEVQSQLRPIFNSVTKRAVDPPKCKAYKDKVADTAKKYHVSEPLDEPLRVEIDVFMGVTASWSKKKKGQALSGALMPTHKKDLDNLAKGIIDGCTGVVWKDDGCIVELEIKKRYDKVPRAEVRVYTIGEMGN